MSANRFIDELRSMGFSEEVVMEVLQSLTDLYIASRIPYGFVVKAFSPTYTFEDVKRTKYWPYSKTTEEILRQHEFIDSGSGYTIYSENENWFFVALTEKGLPIAKEAYENKLKDNLSFVEELFEKYKGLLPILYFGASYESTIDRAFFYSKDTGTIVKSIVEYKVDRRLKFHSKGDHSKIEKYWEEQKRRFEHEKLDIVSMAFQSVASTKTVVSIINEFFSLLYEKRLVLLMPDFSTSSVYTDRERWILTDELLNVVEEKTKIENQEKLKEFIKDFVSVFLLSLGEEGYTKGQILKAIEVIVEENKDLELSYDELLDKFLNVVNEVNSVTGCISKFNEPGGPESLPFLILNKEVLDSAIREFLENLGSRALALA